MAKNITPLTVYRFLPKTNCGECEQKTCMAFASGLIDRKAAVEDCPPILDPKYDKDRGELVDLLRPPVRELRIGTEVAGVLVGGEEVIRRHELTYFNRTALAIEVSDELEPEEVTKRANSVAGVVFERVGDTLKLDMIAVRCASGDPKRFADAAERCLEAGMPLIICALNPAEIGAALERVGDARPLIYAASEDNWEDMCDLALKYTCPLTISADSLEDLASIAGKVRAKGLNEIVLDPGTYPYSGGLGKTLDNFTRARVAAIGDDQEIIGYPLLGIPAVVWMDEGKSPAKALREAMLTAALIGRYADLLILKTMKPWAHLSVMTLRQNLYTDPRKPVAVDAGLHEYGSPDSSSPLLLTTNFALTFYTVESDIQAANVTCYLLVIDTEGIGVQSSVAGGQLDPTKVSDAINESGIKDKIDHKILVVPGMAARLKGDIEDATGFEVIVGPRDSSSISGFIEKKWKK
jgi:acetyl-CoA decarbonylase/synthase complex subunit gamma